MRFITIFPLCQNVHLTKDVGMIPFILHKYHKFDSYIASYNNDSLPYLENEVIGLKHILLRKIFSSEFLNILTFVFLNFKKYDILQLYHLSFKNLFVLYLFKVLNFRNKKAKVYLKMDQNDNLIQLKLSGFKKLLYFIVIRKIDLISLETVKLFDYAKKANFLNGKIKLIPNGFYDNGERIYPNIFNKQNYILTVGLIGDRNKSNEILLEAFALIAEDFKIWNLKLAGKIVPEFQSYIDSFFIRFPHLKERVDFVGFITNRQRLDLLYQEAKIFALTSKSEGFALSYLEALKNGTTIVSTCITPAYDVTNFGKHGKLFEIDNINQFSEKLSELIVELNSNVNADLSPLTIQNFAYENFYWPTIIEKILKEIKFV